MLISHYKNNMKNMEVVVVLLWFMFISLSSFYFYNYGVALPPFIAALMSLLFCIYLIPRIKKNELIKMKWIIFFLIYIVFFGVLLSLKSNDLLIGRLFAPILFFGVALHTNYLLNVKLNLFLFVLKCVLIIHLIAFFAQLLSHYLGFGYIDYIFPITGEMQRAFGGAYESDLLGKAGFVRPTGLYNEPGTFSTNIFIIFLIYKGLNKYANKCDEIILDFFVILSVIFSFSVFGIIFLLLYFLHLVLVNKNTLFIIMPLLFFTLPFIYDLYLYPRFFSDSSDDNGLGFRNEAFGVYIEYLNNNIISLFFGIGLFSDIVKILGDFVWNDLGLLFYSFINFGVLGVLVFLFCILGKNSFSIYIFPLTVIFLICKLAPTSMMFWVVLTCLNYLGCVKSGSIVKSFQIRSN
jgi:hypothetical protein